MTAPAPYPLSHPVLNAGRQSPIGPIDRPFSVTDSTGAAIVDDAPQLPLRWPRMTPDLRPIAVPICPDAALANRRCSEPQSV